MRKIEYQAPEMEIIEIPMQGDILQVIVNSGDTPSISDTPGDGGDAI